MSTAKEFSEDWDNLKSITDIKRWIDKYMSTEQAAMFDEHIVNLQAAWEENSNDDNIGMTIQTNGGNGSFDPIDGAGPVLENVNYFSVLFIMDSDGATYSIFIPYEGDEILNPIACLPENVQKDNLH